VFCFDFGKTRFIRPGIIITKISGSARIELYYDIELEGAPKASLGFNSEIEGNCDTCAVSGKGYTWELLVPRGLRFITVKITGIGKVEFKLDCTAVDYAYPKMRLLKRLKFSGRRSGIWRERTSGLPQRMFPWTAVQERTFSGYRMPVPLKKPLSILSGKRKCGGIVSILSHRVLILTGDLAP